MSRARSVVASAMTMVVSHVATVGACPICFQMEDGPATEGIRAALFVLLGVTVAVLAGFAWFIVRFVRRAGAHEP